MVRQLYASSCDQLPDNSPGRNSEQSTAKLQQENAELKRNNQDLQSANSSLHARNCLMERQLIGLEDALAHTSERNKVFEERNTALEEKLRQKDEANGEKQVSPQEFQDLMQRFQACQQEKAMELQDLRQQLDKQKGDMQQQLAEVEQERDNVLQAMAEEGLELQARIETLCREKKALLGGTSASSGDNSTNDSGTTARVLTGGATVLPPDCGDAWGSCSSSGSPCSVNSSAPTVATRSGFSSPQVQVDCGAGLLLQAVTAAHADEQDAGTARTCAFLSARDAEAMNRKLKLRDIENALLRRQLDTLRRAVQLNVACRLRSSEDCPDSSSS